MDHMSMEVAEKHPSSGYAFGPPWLFKGSALYQLHLVKAEIARSFIPKELKLVEAFGYTLGGFFLAHYDDSPAANFDELVVIAGIVWNPPTSCAWAARVLVNSRDACTHGQKEVGLPSHVGIFSKRSVETRERPKNNFSHFLNLIGIGSDCRGPKKCTEIQVSESMNSTVMPLCTISLPYLGEYASGWYKMGSVSHRIGDIRYRNQKQIRNGWVQFSECLFLALVAELYTALIFSSTVARLNAGCEQWRWLKYQDQLIMPEVQTTMNLVT